MSEFVKTVTTHKINRVIDGCGPNASYMSVIPSLGGGSIELVIGAAAEDRCAAYQNKESLTELIRILTEIRDCMED